MSGVIKSANLTGLSAVQPLGEPVFKAPVVSLSRHDEERDALLRRISRLEGDLRQRDADAAGLRADAMRAFENGKDQGHESGLAAAQDRQSERLGVLEKILAQAQQDLAEKLTALSRLSALLAQDCVEMILGNADDRADLIGRIIETQLGKIDRAMLINIRLSRADFPDDSALSLLSQRLGLSSVSVDAGEEMASGGCFMTLRLGRISVGIDQQWPVLRNLLDDMASPRAAE